MAYTKTNWVNGTTPLNDKNMNKIENELENLDTNISKSTDEYSSTRTYSIGELVIYNNKLYKANQDITTAEAFNSSHWTEVTLLSDVNEIKAVVNNNADNLNKMDEGIKDLDNGQTSLQAQINNLPKKVNEVWGKSMSFEIQPGQHALAMINSTDCLMVWMSGGGMHFTRLYGSEAQVTSSGNTVTINFADNRDFTGNAIIT